MTDRAPDPRWPKLLSLSVHEFRTPMTVVAGYIRMLLKDRAGPVTDQQRRLLEEAEKSCARLSALLAEMSELGALEGGAATFNRSEQDLSALLGEVVSELPDIPDREVRVALETPPEAPRVYGDPVRLKQAFAAVIHALRRELVTSPDLFVRLHVRSHDGPAAAWIAIAGADRIDAYGSARPSALITFDEWRGGVGLSLAVARRVIHAHGGTIWSPADGVKAGAVLSLPVAGAGSGP